MQDSVGRSIGAAQWQSLAYVCGPSRQWLVSIYLQQKRSLDEGRAVGEGTGPGLERGLFSHRQSEQLNLADEFPPT